jgi:hypothetical protein
MIELEYYKVRDSYCLKYDKAKNELKLAVNAHEKKRTEKSHLRVSVADRAHYEALQAFMEACKHYTSTYGFAGGYLK